MSVAYFGDRRQAGKQLASQLEDYAGRHDMAVLALPRGGVPVGFEVSKALGIPLDIFMVRKVGVPGHPELAMGAIASGGYLFLNRGIIQELKISDKEVRLAARKETMELERRERLYHRHSDSSALEKRIVILVDDGLATGATMSVAVEAIRSFNPLEIVVAVPVIALESIQNVREQVDYLAYVIAPYDFRSVGQWYTNFNQTTDDEVIALLGESTPSGPGILLKERAV